MTAKLDRAGQIPARGQQDLSAAFFCTGLQGLIDRRRVQGGAVACRAIVADTEGVRAGRIAFGLSAFSGADECNRREHDAQAGGREQKMTKPGHGQFS